MGSRSLAFQGPGRLAVGGRTASDATEAQQRHGEPDDREARRELERGGGHGKDASKEFIEARNDRGLVDRRLVVASFFADLELLASRADAFVGTAASWTSRVALLAMAGEAGGLPPYAMVDRPLGRLWFS